MPALKLAVPSSGSTHQKRPPRAQIALLLARRASPRRSTGMSSSARRPALERRAARRGRPRSTRLPSSLRIGRRRCGSAAGLSLRAATARHGVDRRSARRKRTGACAHCPVMRSMRSQQARAHAVSPHPLRRAPRPGRPVHAGARGRAARRAARCGSRRATRSRVFDGRGGEYEATDPAHRQGSRRREGRRVARRRARAARSPLGLVQGLPEADKMDWIIQKAVELGVGWIQPLVCDRSVVRLSGERAARREAHWQPRGGRRVRAERAQSRPRGAAHAAVSRAGSPTPARRARAGCCMPGAAAARARTRRPTAPLELLVGPEGGLSERERDLALGRGCEPRLAGPARAARGDGAARRARRDPRAVGRLPPARMRRPMPKTARPQDRSLRQVVSRRHALHPPVGRGDVRDRLRRRGARRRRVPAAHARHQRAGEPGGARGAGARHAPADRGADAPARRRRRATSPTAA